MSGLQEFVFSGKAYRRVYEFVFSGNEYRKINLVCQDKMARFKLWVKPFQIKEVTEGLSDTTKVETPLGFSAEMDLNRVFCGIGFRAWRCPHLPGSFVR